MSQKQQNKKSLLLNNGCRGLLKLHFGPSKQTRLKQPLGFSSLLVPFLHPISPSSPPDSGSLMQQVPSDSWYPWVTFLGFHPLSLPPPHSPALGKGTFPLQAECSDSKLKPESAPPFVYARKQNQSKISDIQMVN